MQPINLDEKTVERLAALANEAGLSIEDYVRSLVGEDICSRPLSEKEFNEQLQGLVFNGPALPADFSRADIYDGRN